MHISAKYRYPTGSGNSLSEAPMEFVSQCSLLVVRTPDLEKPRATGYYLLYSELGGPLQCSRSCCPGRSHEAPQLYHLVLSVFSLPSVSGRPGHAPPHHTKIKAGQDLTRVNIIATTWNLATKFYLQPYDVIFIGQNSWLNIGNFIWLK